MLFKSNSSSHLYLFLIIAAVWASAFAQQAPAQAAPAPAPTVPAETEASAEKQASAVAVYVTGDSIPKTTKDALSAFLLDALVNSGNYRTIERSEAFLSEIDKEHVKQRSGAVDDAQISSIGKQSGARFVCVANITPALGTYQVSARMIDIETADVTASGISDSPLKTLDELKQVSAAVVYKMLGVRVKTDQNFELLTDKEQTALEQSIKQTVQQTMQAKQPKRKSFWIALSCDVVGAGVLGYGLLENSSAQKLIDEGTYSKAKETVTVRNVCYVVGALALLSGISIHIFF